MEKQPFTNAGFKALQAWLYQLDDAALAVEAQQVLTNFKAWMAAHFELSPGQLAFLDLIDQLMISFLAAQTSIAIANRLDISLIKAEEGAGRNGDVRKIIRTENTLVADADARGGYTTGGTLDIIIEYVIAP